MLFSILSSLSNRTHFLSQSKGSLLHNPQLQREWQGRLRWRSVSLTLLASVALQGLLLLQRLSKLPPVGRTAQVIQSFNRTYCIIDPESTKGGMCLLDNLGRPTIQWPFVWADVFRDLSFCLVWGLIVIGIYLLVSDLSKESRRGTLTFLRMSPLSSHDLLLGKLLGVPTLLYIGIGAVLPLHLFAAVQAGYPVGLMVGFYALLGCLTFCCYGAAMWLTLLSTGLQGFQSWLISALSAVLLLWSWNLELSGGALYWFKLFNPLFIVAGWEVEGLGDRQTRLPFGQGTSLNGLIHMNWFGLDVGAVASSYFLFALAHAAILGAWCWIALQRKFRAPAQTALSKSQSYGLTVCFSLLMMGFNVDHVGFDDRFFIGDFWSYPIAMVIYSVLLLFLLLPSRQAVLDWARYCHQQQMNYRTAPSGAALQPVVSRRPSRLRARLKDDASPISLAFAVNLVIMTASLLLGWVLPYGSGVFSEAGLNAIFLWGCNIAFLLVCCLVVEWLSLIDWRHRRWVLGGVVAGLILGWPVALYMVGIYPGSSNFQFLWLISAIPQAIATNLSLPHLDSVDVFMATATYIVLLPALGFGLSARLRSLGQSEWRSLMAPSSRIGNFIR